MLLKIIFEWDSVYLSIMGPVSVLRVALDVCIHKWGTACIAIDVNDISLCEYVEYNVRVCGESENFSWASVSAEESDS